MVLLLGVLTFTPGDVRAQKPLVPRQVPPASEYVLGPGDQVRIHVDDLSDISDQPLRIDPNGYIDLPLAGRQEAGGLTIEQLRQQLRGKLEKYIKDPAVAINLVENQSRMISVIGSVNTPGVHPLQGPQRLIDAISMAGGLRADAGSKVILTRQARWGALPLPLAKPDASGNYSTATVSIESLLSASDPSQNIFVDPGDVISVPKAEIIYVVGTVKKAGGFPLASKDSLSLVQTLSLAEGLDRDAAANRARIIRPQAAGEGKLTQIPVNINRILQGKDPDLPLYANDILYVPNSIAKSTAKRTAEAVLQVATGVVIYRR